MATNRKQLISETEELDSTIDSKIEAASSLTGEGIQESAVFSSSPQRKVQENTKRKPAVQTDKDSQIEPKIAKVEESSEYESFSERRSKDIAELKESQAGSQSKVVEMDSFPVEESQELSQLSQTQFSQTDTQTSARFDKTRGNNKRKRMAEVEEHSVSKPRGTKKAKSKDDSQCPSILFSKLEDGSLKTKASKLGAKIVSETKDCTHLIVDKFRRNFKFFSALIEGKFILQPCWIEESVSEGRFLPEEGYILKDVEAEAKYNYSMKETCQKIKNSGSGQVFRGCAFYCTSQCEPPKDVLKEFISAAGGKLVGKAPKKSSDNFFVISGVDESTGKNLSTKGFQVYTAEFVFAAILRQSLESMYEFQVR
jgi:hypothetical protein